MDEEELEQPSKKITLSNFFESIVSIEKVANRAFEKTNANLDAINDNKSLIQALTQSLDDVLIEIREINIKVIDFTKPLLIFVKNTIKVPLTQTINHFL